MSQKHNNSPIRGNPKLGGGHLIRVSSAFLKKGHPKPYIDENLIGEFRRMPLFTKFLFVLTVASLLATIIVILKN